MLDTFVDTVIYYDHLVWYYLNTRWHNGLLDMIMPFLRNQWFWAPLYLFLVIYIPRRFGKLGWIWCAFFLITFGMSDQISASIMKPYFGRIRPCNDPALSNLVHLLVPCGGGKSFPSSHAANHFSLAFFSILSLKHIAKWIWIPALAWAISVSYAQVYVGVHFPLDVFCGAIIGVCIGIVTGNVFNRRYQLQP
jgi:membrane-associated phospholipid phosphatase